MKAGKDWRTDFEGIELCKRTLVRIEISSLLFVLDPKGTRLESFEYSFLIITLSGLLNVSQN